MTTRWFAAVALMALLGCHTVDAAAAGASRLFHRAGGTVKVSLADGFDENQHEMLFAWAESLSASLLQVYGRWPRIRWGMEVHPALGAGDDPIPWAEVQRGEIDRVVLFIAPRASEAALRGAWTGYHELAHLLLPYRGWGESWFSEGLASYYQNLLQSRSGVIDERQLWQNLYDGFQRGRADTHQQGQPLWQVSDTMRRSGAFMRVYWSGAWYFLQADSQLRRQSGGKLTLDRALARLNDCCAGQHLAVPELVAQLDALNDVTVFRTLYDSVRMSEAMPDVAPLLDSLGITISNGRVELQREGAGAALRRAIAAAPR